MPGRSSPDREALVILSEYALKMKQAGWLDQPITIKVKKPGGGERQENLQVLSLFEKCLNKLEGHLRSPRSDTRSSLFYSFENLGLAMEEIASQKSHSRVATGGSAPLPTQPGIHKEMRRLDGFLQREFRLVSVNHGKLKKDEIRKKLEAIQQARATLELLEPSASSQVSIESLQAEITRLMAALKQQTKSLLEQQSQIRELEERLTQQSEAQPGARSSDQESELHGLRLQLQQVRSELERARKEVEAAQQALTDAERTRDEAVRTVRTQQSLLQDKKTIEEDRGRLQIELHSTVGALTTAQQQIRTLEEERRQMEVTLTIARADADKVPGLEGSIQRLEVDNKRQGERIRMLEQQDLAKEQVINVLRREKEAADIQQQFAEGQRTAAEAQRDAARQAQAKAETELAQLKAILGRLRG